MAGTRLTAEDGTRLETFTKSLQARPSTPTIVDAIRSQPSMTCAAVLGGYFLPLPVVPLIRLSLRIAGLLYFRMYFLCFSLNSSVC